MFVAFDRDAGVGRGRRCGSRGGHGGAFPSGLAKTYRFNPFELTKVWPHADYPLIEVGKLTLDRNPTDHHSQIEQGAWEPSNMVPGIGASPDKMLLGRMFAYADAHRYRIGANYNQLPVNAPHAPVHSYSTAGHMRYRLATDPVYAPNSKGGPLADTARYELSVTGFRRAPWMSRPHIDDSSFRQFSAAFFETA